MKREAVVEVVVQAVQIQSKKNGTHIHNITQKHVLSPSLSVCVPVAFPPFWLGAFA